MEATKFFVSVSQLAQRLTVNQDSKLKI